MSDPVAVVAAHPDDEVLGCGGTIARLSRLGRPVHVLLLADGETSRSNSDVRLENAVEARNSSAQAAANILGCKSLRIVGLPDNRLDGQELLKIVQHIEAFMQQHKPVTVFTHHSGDVNVDHRVVHNAVTAACRPQPGYSVKELLFFEVASSTEWRPPGSGEPFVPNWFVDITATLEQKLEALRAYSSELRPFPHPRSIEAIKACARWRGATVGVHAAEAFILGRKIIC